MVISRWIFATACMGVGVKWLLAFCCAFLANLCHHRSEESHFVVSEQRALEVVAHTAAGYGVSIAVGSDLVLDAIKTTACFIQNATAVVARQSDQGKVLFLGQLKIKPASCCDMFCRVVSTTSASHGLSAAFRTTRETFRVLWREHGQRPMVLALAATSCADVQFASSFCGLPFSLPFSAMFGGSKREACCANTGMTLAMLFVFERKVFSDFRCLTAKALEFWWLLWMAEQVQRFTHGVLTARMDLLSGHYTG